MLFLGTFLFFYGLGDRDVITRNESEAAFAARDMLETGRILVPYLFEQPFIDNRPPGSWWLVAAAYKLTGRDDEWAARLPSATAALVCVILVYLIGRRAAGPTAGFISAMILMGSLGFVLQARMSQQDMLLTLGTLGCYWAFWMYLDGNSHPFRYALAFQVFLGLTALIKGPAVVINVIVPLAVYILYARRWNSVKWGTLVGTLPISLGLILWWYLYIWVQEPWMREQLISRFSTQSNLHVKPFYYYLQSLPELLGLVVLFLPALVLGWRKAPQDQKRGPLGLFLIASSTMFLLYHLFPSKRLHYIVPLLPELSLALGLAIVSQNYHKGRYAKTLVLALAALAPFLVGAWIAVAALHLGMTTGVLEWAVLVGATGLSALIWSFYRRGRNSLGMQCFWAGYLLILGLGLGGVYPHFDNLRSTRGFAEKVAALVPAGAQIGSSHHHSSLPYYAKRPMQYVRPANAKDFLNSPRRYLIVIGEDLRQIPKNMRQIVFSQASYRGKHIAYLLQGG